MHPDTAEEKQFSASQPYFKWFIHYMQVCIDYKISIVWCAPGIGAALRENDQAFSV